ncbi:excinuclease ABC subunit UvrC [Thorsellia anophelis]|uniref:UvrABC system protein C n=1 Tax=Thorsellia anophelis DSM 18579 TaxID=1123402 RepID=A0A1I0BM25_9GAMM|nr:excinuclease ABC subunit UvrC [Thorsellia anophelis]SET08000.1 Excinuclease ABC subunit C [Thorsellia anophelis DSM 18579]
MNDFNTQNQHPKSIKQSTKIEFIEIEETEELLSGFNSKLFLKNVTSSPGVYRMYDIDEVVIYVGKAKDLKKRLSSYFRKNLGSIKTETLVKQISNIDVTVTNTETEALLLEHNYIKLYQPKYNVLLRDDKSYPYLFLSNDKHPRISIYRGSKKAKGQYFGPYPNAQAVRDSLAIIQRLFPIRQCENTVYKNRSRPCLQYQIGRCCAPCVDGYISDTAYSEQVNLVKLFLEGKNTQVINELVQKMEVASELLAFEKAAAYRDQIQAVRSVTEKQFVSNNGNDIDVIGYDFQSGVACLHVLFIRQGKVLGSRSYFPNIPKNTELIEVVQTFIGQFYLQASEGRDIPQQILIDFTLPEIDLLAHSLSQSAGRKIEIQSKPRGDRAKYLQLASTNAKIALSTKLVQKSTISDRLTALAEVLNLDSISRLECFDISHLQGEQTVASCVVFDTNGPLRSAYRRYNIEGITPGDDYAAMGQVLTRRYGKMITNENIPDVIIIDGGKGQLGQAFRIFAELNVSWDKSKPILLGVAKGVERRAGLETLFLEPEGDGFSLPSDSLALHLIQHIRDESHDHAIGGHRKKRGKVKGTSSLESIPGVGAKRRQALLKYMGGMQTLKNATIDEIAKVPGISLALAEKIHAILKQS